MLTTSLPIEIYISVSGLRGSHTSYLHSFSLKSPSTQTSSYHQFYIFIMEKSSNHQLLNGKISISSFPKFSISTAFKDQIHQIITKFRPNLQSTGNPTLPPPFQELKILYALTMHTLFSSGRHTPQLVANWRIDLDTWIFVKTFQVSAFASPSLVLASSKHI